MQNSKLLPPSPPFVDRRDPNLIAWRQDQHEQAIEYLHTTKMDTPSASKIKAVGSILAAILGLLGLVSPAQFNALLKLLLQLLQSP